MKAVIIFLLGVFAAIQTLVGYELVVTSDKAEGIYNSGDEALFNIQLLQDGSKAPGYTIKYTIYKNGMPIDKLKSSSDQPIVIKQKLDFVGSMAIVAKAFDANGKEISLENTPVGESGRLGIMVSPEKIKEGRKEPEDLWSFWETQREELNKVPIKASRKEVKSEDASVIMYDVKVDCSGGMPVSGYLAMPRNAKKKSLPAIVIFQAYGVCGASKPKMEYAKNAIAFRINAHGILNGQPSGYYEALKNGELKSYQNIGRWNRDKYYFRGMYLRAMRALDYVKSMPEWDGENLIVTGGSQGGGQAVAAAALDQEVSLCVASVPGMADHAGKLAQRRPGWPIHVFPENGAMNPSDWVSLKSVVYFDNIYLAKRIKGEVWLSTGGGDFTCAPTSVYAIYNNLPNDSKKHIQFFPNGGHNSFSYAQEGLQKIKTVFNQVN